MLCNNPFLPYLRKWWNLSFLWSCFCWSYHLYFRCRARNGSTHRRKHWRLCPRPSQIITIYLFGAVFLVDVVILFFFSSSMIQFLFLSAPLNSAMANQSSSTQWSNPWWTEKQAPSGLKMPLEASQKEISKMAWCLSRCPPPTITRQSKTLNMCLPSTSQTPISYTADQHHHRRDPISRSTTTLTLSPTTLLKWKRWVQRTGTKVDDSVLVIMQRKYQWGIQGRGPGGPLSPTPPYI